LQELIGLSVCELYAHHLGMKKFIFSFPVEGVKGFIFDMGVHLVSFQLDECYASRPRLLLS
jgi:hypothetical protein